MFCSQKYEKLIVEFTSGPSVEPEVKELAAKRARTGVVQFHAHYIDQATALKGMSLLSRSRVRAEQLVLLRVFVLFALLVFAVCSWACRAGSQGAGGQARAWA